MNYKSMSDSRKDISFLRIKPGFQGGSYLDTVGFGLPVILI